MLAGAVTAALDFWICSLGFSVLYHRIVLWVLFSAFCVLVTETLSVLAQVASGVVRDAPCLLSDLCVRRRQLPLAKLKERTGQDCVLIFIRVMHCDAM